MMIDQFSELNHLPKDIQRDIVEAYIKYPFYLVQAKLPDLLEAPELEAVLVVSAFVNKDSSIVSRMKLDTALFTSSISQNMVVDRFESFDPVYLQELFVDPDPDGDFESLKKWVYKMPDELVEWRKANPTRAKFNTFDTIKDDNESYNAELNKAFAGE